MLKVIRLSFSILRYSFQWGFTAIAWSRGTSLSNLSKDKEGRPDQCRARAKTNINKTSMTETDFEPTILRCLWHLRHPERHSLYSWWQNMRVPLPKSQRSRFYIASFKGHWDGVPLNFQTVMLNARIRILILSILESENRNHTKLEFDWSISFRGKLLNF